jgi:hypothetical protein
LTLCLLVAIPSQAVLAAENTASVTKLVKATDLPKDKVLTPKESVEKFIKEHPEYKKEVMDILQEKGALNPDKTIKDDLGQAKTAIASDFLYTGWKYTFAGSLSVDEFYLKTLVAGYTNYSYVTPLPVDLTQSYTVSVVISSTTTIGSSAGLEDAFKVNAGVTFGYSYTSAASTVYGMHPIIPVRTYAKFSANPYSTCYSYFERYYLLGIAVGSENTVGVFKPTGAHWYYEEFPVS